MSRTNKWDARSIGGKMVAGTRFGTMVQTLAGTLTLDADSPTCLALDPGGATRIVLMPAATEFLNGLMFFLVNTADAAEDLTIKDSTNTTTYGTVSQNETAWLVLAGGAWRVGTMTTT